MLLDIVSSTSKNKRTGADNFLPVMIFLVLSAKPSRPLSNLEFIRDFRSSRRLRGFEEYYFTSYESTLEFIDDIDASKLKINEEEF